MAMVGIDIVVVVVVAELPMIQWSVYVQTQEEPILTRARRPRRGDQWRGGWPEKPAKVPA
jgi:hypothetical protein